MDSTAGKNYENYDNGNCIRVRRLKKYLASFCDLILCGIFRSAVFFLQNLPVRLLYLLAELLGTAAYLLLKKRREQIYHNLEIVYPQGPPFDKKRFARKNFVHICCFALEFFVARRLMRRGNWYDYISGPGAELLAKDCPRAKGGVLASGHIGSLLVCPHLLAQIGYPVAVIIRPMGGPRLQKAIQELFEWAGAKAIMKRGAYDEIKKLVQEGMFPTLAMDQHGGRSSLYVDFLGRKAYTPAGGVALARRFRLPIYVGAVMRTGRFRFTCYVEKIQPIITDDKQSDLEKMAENVNRLLGALILQYPEQWLWMHRRWRPQKDVPPVTADAE